MKIELFFNKLRWPEQRLPKDREPETITLDEARVLIANAPLPAADAALTNPRVVASRAGQ